MADSMEVQLARIEERQKSQDEKLDALADNQKAFFKAVEEFHTFKGQVKIMGTALVLIVSAGTNWLFKRIGG